MTQALIVTAVLLIGLAVALLAWSSRMRRANGLPAGRVLYSDTSAGRRGKSLYSARYRLTGAPDYIVQTREGLVPVEVKPGRDGPEPHESHLLQVLAYCLLVEETEGKPPPYGLLRYSHDTFKVDYNANTRAYLISVLEEMQAAMQQSAVHRNHDVAGRCRACAYRPVCEESLWDAR